MGRFGGHHRLAGSPTPNGTITYTAGTVTDRTAAGNDFEIDNATGSVTVSGVTIDKTANPGPMTYGALVIQTPSSSVLNVTFTGPGSHLADAFSNQDSALNVGGINSNITIDLSGTTSGNVLEGNNGIFSNTANGSFTLTTGGADQIISTLAGGNGIEAQTGTATIVNNATIEGDGTNNFATGILVYGAGASSITNNGTISSKSASIILQRRSRPPS